jgi:hypothetical protein
MMNKGKMKKFAMGEITRITATMTAHHEEFGEGPDSVQAGFASYLDSNEQSFTRKLKVKETWKQTDFGWLNGKVGHVKLENRIGRRPEKIPTDAELELLSKKVVLVGFREKDEDDPPIELPPGEFDFFKLRGELWMRSATGIVEVIVFAMPR